VNVFVKIHFECYHSVTVCCKINC